jgi:hypothetical protein
MERLSDSVAVYSFRLESELAVQPFRSLFRFNFEAGIAPNRSLLTIRLEIWSDITDDRITILLSVAPRHCHGSRSGGFRGRQNLVLSRRQVNQRKDHR